MYGGNSLSGPLEAFWSLPSIAKARWRVGSGTYGQVFALSPTTVAKVLREESIHSLPVYFEAPARDQYQQKVLDAMQLPAPELEQWWLQRELQINRDAYRLNKELRATGIAVPEPGEVREVALPSLLGITYRRRHALTMERIKGVKGEWTRILGSNMTMRLEARLMRSKHIFLQSNLSPADMELRNTIYVRQKDLLYVIDFGSWAYSDELRRTN